MLKKKTLITCLAIILIPVIGYSSLYYSLDSKNIESLIRNNGRYTFETKKPGYLYIDNTRPEPVLLNITDTTLPLEINSYYLYNFTNTNGEFLAVDKFIIKKDFAFRYTIDKIYRSTVTNQSIEKTLEQLKNKTYAQHFQLDQINRPVLNFDVETYLHNTIYNLSEAQKLYNSLDEEQRMQLNEISEQDYQKLSLTEKIKQCENEKIYWSGYIEAYNNEAASYFGNKPTANGKMLAESNLKFAVKVCEGLKE